MSVQALLLLRSESPSGKFTKLRTMAASNNRDHPTRSLSSSPLASTINCSPGSQALLEVTYQDHSIEITLLLLVRATYIHFCSSRTSHSWWITQSTQHHRRGCNNIPSFFTTNHTDRTFFVWRLNSAWPPHPGHSTILLRSKIPSGVCAKLRTVAANNNSDHARNLSYYCLLATRIHICSSRTSHSWWITHLTQHHQRGCNSPHTMVLKDELQ